MMRLPFVKNILLMLGVLGLCTGFIAIINQHGEAANNTKPTIHKDQFPRAQTLKQWYQGRGPFTGKGVAIAVVDSGIDTTHDYLGNSSSCNINTFRNNKVIDGYDFGEKDPLPCDTSGHGTGMSGIIAADAPSKPRRDGFLGGIAPEVKLYALKITFDATGVPSKRGLQAALKWVVQHWNDNPSHPIKVVSISNTWATKAPTEEECAVVSSNHERILYHELDQLHKLGITVFISAGNKKNPYGVSYPGCIDRLHSVSAFNFSKQRVNATSNNGLLVSVLAPMHGVVTVRKERFRNIGGTSISTAFTSGVAAVLQQAAKHYHGRFLTSQELLGVMQTSGDYIADTRRKDRLKKPFINIARAIDFIKKGKF